MTVRAPHTLGCALCLGLAGATVARVGLAAAVLMAGVFLALAVAATSGPVTLALLALGVAIAGWGAGSFRLAAIDHSVLAPRIGTAERALVEIAEPARHGSFELRMRAVVLRWGEAERAKRNLIRYVRRTPESTPEPQGFWSVYNFDEYRLPTEGTLMAEPPAGSTGGNAR